MADREAGRHCLQENDGARTTRGEVGMNESGQSDIMTVAETAQYLRISVSALYDVTPVACECSNEAPDPLHQVRDESR